MVHIATSRALEFKRLGSVPSLSDAIVTALAGRPATVSVCYRRFGGRLPTVRATRPMIGYCPELSFEIEAVVRSWISLATAQRLTVIEIGMPATRFEADAAIGGQTLSKADIAAFRTEIGDVFRRSGRLAGDEHYVELLIRVGLHSGAPLVQAVTVSAEDLTGWEDLQVYGFLTDWVEQHRAWFAGVRSVGLVVSLGG